MTRMASLALVAVSAIGCGWVVTLPAGPRATATVELVVEPGEATALSVTTSAGDIRVGTCLAERGAMTVVARKSAASEEDLARIHLFARVEGDVILVGYTLDPGTEGAGVSFTMSPVEVRRAELKSSAGDLRVTGLRGDLVLRSSAGDIGVERADGAVDAETSAGDVRVSGRLRGNCRLQSSAGDLEASIPGDSRLRITAHTGAGNSLSEHPVAAGKSFASGSIVGTLGDGSDGSLEMRTSAGDLALRRLP